MSNWTIHRRVNLANADVVETVFNAGLSYVGDSRAHTWIVDCVYGSRNADLTGYTAHSYFIRADDVTVPIEGTVTGNQVSVVLDKKCYAIPGQLKGILRIENAMSGEIVTVGALVLNLLDGSTSSAVDPGEIIPTLEELLAQLEHLEQSTDAADVATGNANTAADNANAATEESKKATQAAKESTAAADEATKRANTAAEAAENATSEAERATAEADEATERSLAATADAQRATAEADEATQAAKEATENANIATDKANTAADGADESAEAADEATDKANAAANRLSNVELEVETLPPSSDPTASVTQTEDTTTFHLGIPTSNLAYATFWVDDEMNLIMRSPEGFNDIRFELNDKAELEVFV